MSNSIPEILLIHSEKFALMEAASKAPETEETRSILALMKEVGDADGYVQFTAAQSTYIRETLIPWARENAPFGGGSRGKLGMACLESVGERLIK